MDNLINLNGKKLNSDNTRYYNLHTSRLVKNIPPGYLKAEQFLVIGSEDELRAFAQNNDIPLEKVLPRASLKKEYVCQRGSACSDDIERIPLESLNSLCEFSLVGLKSKGRVLDIIDGDTISLAFYIPFDFLSQIKPRSSNRYQCSALPYAANTGFIARFRCRLYGIDTVEKQFAKGIEAKEYLNKLCQKTNYIVFAQLFEADKFGRQLVKLFSYANDRKSLNDLILEQKDLSNEYYGGKKKEFVDVAPKLKPSLFERLFRH